MARYLLAALIAVLWLAPATASAEVVEFGSDLSSPANIAINHGADTSYWHDVLPNGGLINAPADGQVTVVKLKGGVLPNERMRRTEAENLAQIIHFQVLRPRGENRFKVVNLSTGHLEIPLTADQDKVTQYEPVNLCVKRGDIVAFNTIGAHEYRRDLNTQGAEYQVFGRVPDAATNWYEKDNGLNVGVTFDPDPAVYPVMGGLELLMRQTLATGPDATDICPGGYAQHIFRGLEFKGATQPTVKTKTRKARFKAFCHGENYGGCFGKVSLSATIDGVDTLLGETKLSLKNSYTDTIEIPLSPDSVLKLQRAGSVTGTLTADANDNPRSDKRVKWDSVPVQQKTTTDKILLKADKPACVVPDVVGKSSAVAKRTLRKKGCAAGKITRQKDKKRAGRIIAQSVAPKTVLANGARVGLTLATK